MIHVQAVIGANFGDEGKGVITDYLSTPNTLVVRHSGGAQAGHTVTLPNGVHHTFHHFGAGTFQGASTLLGPQFVCNPIQFLRERTQLKGWKPTVYCDRNALITTPYDMILNQTMERQRTNRHGSCGLGINETVTRSLCGPTIQIGDDARTIREHAHEIRKHLQTRALTLGVTLPGVFLDPILIDNFVADTNAFFAGIVLVDSPDLLSVQTHLVFEGAQGLGLDEINGVFPYVTRSRTGLPNVLPLIDSAGISDPVTVYYVTRAYLTRHGNGPLPNEMPGHPYKWKGPEANEENAHQGHFRYAPLDVEAMVHRIALDIVMHSPAHARLAITCLDQILGDTHEHVERLSTIIPCGLESYGPTRSHVVDRQNHDHVGNPWDHAGVP